MFNPPMYGADVPGTVYDDNVNVWNIGTLDSILSQTLDDTYGVKIPGVNTPYLYFGMWRSTFAWHTEDMDLYSINYLHFGAPKTWYAIPPEHGQRMERLAKGFFPGDAMSCSSFFRHKSTLISPSVLYQYSIPVNKVTQEAGQFMITFPFGYHCGFNHGYNCAESTNFALERWIEFGINASKCQCRGDNVRIDMELFVRKYKPHLLSSLKISEQKNGYSNNSSTCEPPAEKAHRQRRSVAGRRAKTPSDENRKVEEDERATVATAKYPKVSEPFSMNTFWEECYFNHVCSLSSSCCICALFDQPRKKIHYPHGPVESQQQVMKQLCAPSPSNSMISQTNLTSLNSSSSPQQQAIITTMQNVLTQYAGLSSATSLDYGQIVAIAMALQSQNTSPSVATKGGQLMPTTTSGQLQAQGVASVAQPSSSTSRPGTSCNTYEDDSNDDESLLFCSICGICVHRGCYGVAMDESSVSWMCKRCKSQAWEQCCVLCNLRGGALKPTACKKTSWAHITCAVAIPECSFGKSQLREPIHVDAISTDRWTLRCRYCALSGGQSYGACVQCSSPRCCTSFHVTCAHRMGLPISLGESAIIVRFYCSKHSYMAMYAEARPSLKISVGDRVAAKRTASTYGLADVVSITQSRYYEVLFDDGSISHNVHPNDIKNMHCSLDVTPQEQERVQVLWPDGKLYWGAFLQTTMLQEYEVKFDDGTTRLVDDEEIFEENKVPKKLKLSHASRNGSGKPIGETFDGNTTTSLKDEEQ